MEQAGGKKGKTPPLLTPRQEQVLGCLAAGMTEGEIGERLQISPRTVRMHCDALRARLAVTRRRLIPIAYRRVTGRDPLELFDRPPAETAGGVGPSLSINAHEQRPSPWFLGGGGR